MDTEGLINCLMNFINIEACQFNYSKTLNKEYIERIYQMSYSLLSDNGMLQIFSILIK